MTGRTGMVGRRRRLVPAMKTLVSALVRLVRLLAALESRTALRPVVVLVRK